MDTENVATILAHTKKVATLIVYDTKNVATFLEYTKKVATFFV